MPIETAAITPIFKWIWDNFGKDIVSAATERLWQELKWEDAALKYSNKVMVLYGTTLVLGQLEPVLLEDIFTQVYILDKPTALRRFSIEELEKHYATGDRSRLREKRQRGDEMVDSEDKLFILGKPGAGKTTFLKHVALQAVNGDINRVPIFVTLKELADSGQEILDFMVGEFAICSFPEARPFVERLLKAGRAVVLFDGLDEVGQAGEQRANLITALNNFIRQYSDCQCLITCRLAATDYHFEQFTYVEMADFDKPQIRSYVTKWFKDRKKRDLFLEEMEKPDNKGLWELAQIPLLLSLLCLAFQETLAFPQRRVEIYEEALEALLKKWDSTRNIRRDEVYRKLSLGRKRQMLAEVAATNFEKGVHFIPERELEQQFASFLQRVPPTDVDEPIDGQVVLKAIEAQHGIFVERARQIHSFSHLTFQEYFTAKYIVEKEATGTLERLMTYVTDDRWREVFLLTVSLLYEADAFFELFLSKLDELAVRDDKVIALLEWANTKAKSVQQGTYKPPAVRSSYLGLTLALDRALDRNHGRDPFLAKVLVHTLALAIDLACELDRALTIAHTLDLVHPLARALVLTHAHTHTNALDLDRTLTLGRTLAIALAQTLDRANALDLARILDRELDRALKLSEQLQVFELQQALKVLQKPDFEASTNQWLDLSNAIQSIMIRHCQFQVWELSGTEVNHLHHYLRASKLLVECLKLAYVSDRAQIENRLLLLPK